MKDSNKMSMRERMLYEGEDELRDVDLFDDGATGRTDVESKGETTSTGGRSKHMSMDLAGSVFMIAADGRVLSLPIPSESSDDPLNWGFWRRLLILTIMGCFAAIASYTIQTPGNLFPALMREFTAKDMAPFGIDFAASLPTLCLGISFFFWIPLCVAFGRRPVLLTAALMMAGATMGAGFAPGFHQLLVALGFIGFAAGAPLGMSLLQIIDLTFIHERPLALAAYWSLPSVVALIPLAELPGMLDAALEWRKPYRVIGLTTLILALLIFLFVPETYFLRPPVALDGRVLVQSGTEKIQVYDEVREVPANNSNTHNTMAGLDSTLPVDLDALPLTVHSWRVSPLFRVGPAARGVDLRAAFACFVQVFLVLGNPLVFWLALLNAVNFGAMMCIGVGFPVVLSKPPYSLPPAAVGRINDSAALGSLLALPAAYFLLNNVTKALTRRNRGVRHAEFYLPAFVLPVVSGAASVLLYGFAAARGWSPVWYHVSYGINSFSYVSGGIANTVWATESLPQWAAPAIAVVGGASYAASWGISGILEPWEASWGIEPVAIALGIATGIVGLGAIPLAFWGKSVRQYISGHWGAYQPGALRPQTRQVE